jgi:hypothetical protein
MRDAESSNRGTKERRRAAFSPWMIGGIVVVAVVVVASVLAFGARTASARQSIFIPYWYTQTSHQQAHFDDGCECYSGYDTIVDGFDRSYDLFPPDNALDLSPVVPTGPTGTRTTGVSFETFGSTRIKEFHEFQPGATGKPAKFMGTVKAPAGVNGATVTTQSTTGGASQVVTWSKNGVTIGSPVSVNIAYYLDFAEQQKNTCASGLLSPPIAVVPTLLNSDGTTSAGRPVLEPCTFKVAHKIKYTK